MRSIVVGAVALAVSTSAVQAGAITEIEPNDSIATAQFINPANYPANAFAFDGFLSPGDVDYITFTVPDAIALTALTVSIPPDFANVDTMLGIFNSVGVLLDSDDDEGPGDFSFLEVQLTPGTYYIAVSGSGDVDFTGDHNVEGGYKLIVGFNVIPAPGALALLGVAALLRRRRRS